MPWCDDPYLPGPEAMIAADEMEHHQNIASIADEASFDDMSDSHRALWIESMIREEEEEVEKINKEKKRITKEEKRIGKRAAKKSLAGPSKRRKNTIPVKKLESYRGPADFAPEFIQRRIDDKIRFGRRTIRDEFEIVTIREDAYDCEVIKEETLTRIESELAVAENPEERQFWTWCKHKTYRALVEGLHVVEFIGFDDISDYDSPTIINSGGEPIAMNPSDKCDPVKVGNMNVEEVLAKYSEMPTDHPAHIFGEDVKRLVNGRASGSTKNDVVALLSDLRRPETADEARKNFDKYLKNKKK